ncbi:hypothetical protein G9A89_011717 [Geosiphon pyriformis]|nr:hypothetical protein G9A89_011717 [Geosiphon pyriformis]
MFSLRRLGTRFTQISPRLASQSSFPSQVLSNKTIIPALGITQQRSLTKVRRINIPRAFVHGDAPSWEAEAVCDGKFQRVSLEDYVKNKKYLVMVFYPLDFTFVCPTELISFSDRIEEFHALNAEVVGVSCDSKYSHLVWSEMPRIQGGLGNLRFPLISDFSKEISIAYGVLYEEQGFPFRGLFIIDDEGLIRVIQLNDTEIGRSVNETLRLIEAIQYYKLNGEVCPANWQKGEPAIKPNPEDSKSYFKKLHFNK